MKKVLTTLMLFYALLGCKKELSTEAPKDPEICTFGIQPNSFNMVKRTETPELLSAAKATRGPKNPKGGTSGGGGTTTNPQPANGAVILLDFDGYYYPGGAWSSTPLDLRYSGMNSTEIEQTVKRIQEDYSPFGVIVTTDEAVYNAAPTTLRTRVVFTESWEWYGKAGGVSYVGSFTWGDNTPCFVFSSLLGYGSKMVAEAGSHEAGHTLGLRHQARYDASGTKTEEYNSGDGSGEISWAPIMGVGYYKNLTLWHNGLNSYGAYQDDIGTITKIIPLKTDLEGSTIQTAVPLTASVVGLINSANDVDVFSLTTVSGSLSVLPTVPGPNADLLVKIYSESGQLLYTLNNVVTIGESVQLAAGTKYFVSVQPVSNQYASTYGMIGTYSVIFN